MKMIVKIDDDPTDQNDLIITVVARGPEVQAIQGGPECMTRILFDYQDTETQAQRKTRAQGLVNTWRLAMGLPVPTKIIFMSSVS